MRGSKKKQLTLEERYAIADEKDRKKLAKRQKRAGSGPQTESTGLPETELDVQLTDALAVSTFELKAGTFKDGSVFVPDISADDGFVRSVPSELNWLDPSFRSATSNFAACIRPVLGDESLVHAYETKIRDFIAKDIQAAHAIARFNLTPLEASCIIIFTMSASDALPDGGPDGASFHRTYNTALSGRDSRRIRDFADYSYHLQRGLDKLPPACAPGSSVTLYRGLDRPAAAPAAAHTDCAAAAFAIDFRTCSMEPRKNIVFQLHSMLYLCYAASHS